VTEILSGFATENSYEFEEDDGSFSITVDENTKVLVFVYDDQVSFWLPLGAVGGLARLLPILREAKEHIWCKVIIGSPNDDGTEPLEVEANIPPLGLTAELMPAIFNGLIAINALAMK
jgi:hypothetical protein